MAAAKEHGSMSMPLTLVMLVIIALARTVHSDSTVAVIATPEKFLQAAPDHTFVTAGDQPAVAAQGAFDDSVTFWLKASFSLHTSGQQLLFEIGNSTSGLSLSYGSEEVLSLSLCRAGTLDTLHLALPMWVLRTSDPVDIVVSLDRSEDGVEVQRLWAAGEVAQRTTSTVLPWGSADHSSFAGPGSSTLCGATNQPFTDGSINFGFGLRVFHGWAFFAKLITINDQLLKSPWELIGTAPDLRLQQPATFPGFSGEGRFAPKPDASLSPFVLQLSARLFPKTHGPPEILFEVGGRSLGLTLAYVVPNTVALRHCPSDLELTVGVPEVLFSSTAPFVDIIVSRNKSDELLLSVSGISAEKALPGDDVADGNEGGFLRPATQICNFSNAEPFTSGSVDLQLGLNFWVDEVYARTLRTQRAEQVCELGEMTLGSDGLRRCPCQHRIGQFAGGILACLSMNSPTIQCPQDVVIGESSPATWPQPLVSDDVDRVDELLLACDPPSGATDLGIGSHNVTCTVTDTSNRTASCSFTLTRLDDTAPVFDGCPPPPTLLQLDPGTNTTRLAYDIPQAHDNHVTHVQINCNPPPGTAVGIGYTPVTCLARDGRQGTTCTFNVKVEDQEPPTLACPNNVQVAVGADRTYGLLPTVSRVHYEAPTAQDNADGFLPATCWPPSGSTFPVGQRSIVACRATDISGNAESCTFSITVGTNCVGEWTPWECEPCPSGVARRRFVASVTASLGGTACAYNHGEIQTRNCTATEACKQVAATLQFGPLDVTAAQSAIMLIRSTLAQSLLPQLLQALTGLNVSPSALHVRELLVLRAGTAVSAADTTAADLTGAIEVSIVLDVGGVAAERVVSALGVLLPDSQAEKSELRSEVRSIIQHLFTGTQAVDVLNTTRWVVATSLRSGSSVSTTTAATSTTATTQLATMTSTSTSGSNITTDGAPRESGRSSEASALLNNNQATGVVSAAAVLGLIVLVIAGVKVFRCRRKDNRHRTAPSSPDLFSAEEPTELQAISTFQDTADTTKVTSRHKWNPSIYDIVRPEDKRRAVVHGLQNFGQQRLPYQASESDHPPPGYSTNPRNVGDASRRSSSVSSTDTIGTTEPNRGRGAKKLQSKQSTEDTPA